MSNNNANHTKMTGNMKKDNKSKIMSNANINRLSRSKNNQ